MAKSFAAQVGVWAKKVDGALRVVFQEAAQRIALELDGELGDQVYASAETGYKRTGFLRSSLVASKEAMPRLTRGNPGVAVPADLGDVMLVITGADIGDTIYLGYTANYAAHVHYGSNGRAPRPWVMLVAQRWEQIVAETARDVRKRLGL
ncbi:MAG: HK97 gp10 family phage protein [bacterium]|nr:HK97 gp10 family phage protein [bacterium]